MIRTAILGASGYTGCELIRLLIRHPYFKLVSLSAEKNAGQPLSDVFPQFVGCDLPGLVTTQTVNFRDLDLLFCALPHGTTQTVIGSALDSHPELKIVDLSADFRLRNAGLYEHWYGHKHQRSDLQSEAVYGLTETYRSAIEKARLVANPGCYTTTALTALIPLLANKQIKPEGLIIDAKSGVTGAGRAPRQEGLFTEVNEGFYAYGVASHRHLAELDQELSLVANKAVQVTFTPHLLPVQRGIYATIYAELVPGASLTSLRETLINTYRRERFIRLLPEGKVPKLQFVTGSNDVHIALMPDRYSHRVIIIATLDNLIKGASGQAIQNANLMFGYNEALCLEATPLFP